MNHESSKNQSLGAKCGDVKDYHGTSRTAVSHLYLKCPSAWFSLFCLVFCLKVYPSQGLFVEKVYEGETCLH